MTEVQFSFIMPQVPPDRAQRSRFVEDLNRALELVSGHFESARISDHLMDNIELDDLESFTTLAYLAANWIGRGRALTRRINTRIQKSIRVLRENPRPIKN